ncbi:MAG: helix-hairpin-helix domain-containing protein [Polyangiales bacterium]|nr:helix-hairpin-helix domain-containing protein [Myxococcales bacterium]
MSDPVRLSAPGPSTRRRLDAGVLRRACVLGALVAACCLGASPGTLSAQAADGGSASGESGSPAILVNLNTATVAELQRLPGVGPARAEAIVAYRERRPFRRIEELMRIRGIGRKTFRRLRPMLTLASPEGP